MFFMMFDKVLCSFSSSVIPSTIIFYEILLVNHSEKIILEPKRIASVP